MMLLIDKILDYTYDIVVAIAMIYSIYLWVKKGYTAKQKYFFLYLVAVLIVDVFGLLIRKTFDLPQAYLYFPFIIFSILYFRYFYVQEYKTKKDHFWSFYSFIIFSIIHEDYSKHTLLLLLHLLRF